MTLATLTGQQHAKLLGAGRRTVMLRVAGAGLLIAAGAIHLDLYLTGYQTIPTIGWLFLLQVITAFGLGLTVLALPGRVVLAGRLAAAAGAGFALATLGGYLLSVWTGLFGFREIRATAGITAGVIEVAAFAALAALALAPVHAAAAPARLPAPIPPALTRVAATTAAALAIAALVLLGTAVAGANAPPPAATGQPRITGEAPPGKLLELVIQRLLLARDVAAVKYASRQPIDDAVREHQIPQAVASALNASWHCRESGIQFFRDQIEANKAIQRGLHHRWYAHPEAVPPVHRGLAAEIRLKLDRINRQIIRQLECLAGMPEASCEYLADVADKRLSTAVSGRQLPRLHRAAALFAMRSLCTADSYEWPVIANS